MKALYHDLLINVTSFFRDPDVFEALKERVYPEIIKGKPAVSDHPRLGAGLLHRPGGLLAGHELDRVLRRSNRTGRRFRSSPPISATRRPSTKPAPAFIPIVSKPRSSPSALRRFFKKEEHVYRIDKSIRDLCVFARQNLTSDPPFSHVDLVSCRNVLIYLSPPLQKRVMPTFHYALNSPGFLVLGSSETVGDHSTCSR